MDQIILCDLEVKYRVGVTAAERAKPQLLLITLEMACPLARAAASDDLAETINYQDIANRVLSFGEGREWQLIETLAEALARALLQEFPIHAVTIEVKKFIIPQTRYVSVRLTRGRPA